MKKRAIVGVVPLVDAEKESLWMLPGYLQGVEQEGGIPLVFPLSTDPALLRQLVDTVDGLLFTGGQDVSPALYGEPTLPECGELCPMRDEMERTLLQLAIKADKPLLGICRGIQLINAALGGTLYQDLPSQHPSQTRHHQTPPYDAPIHAVNLLDGTPLAGLLGKSSIEVNSYHHQAVRALSPRLRLMALSEDGLIEAAYLPGARFFWAVQWHPEFSFQNDANSRAIFRAFLRACEQPQ